MVKIRDWERLPRNQKLIEPQTRKEIIKRFELWFYDEIETFKEKINFKNIENYYGVKITKI